MFEAIIGFIIGLVLALLVAVFGFFGFLLPGSTTVESAEPGWSAYSPVPVVVDAAWLDVERTVNPNLVVVAVTSESNFENQRIPGAVRIDARDLDIAGTVDPDWITEITRVLGDAGIAPDSTVVVYDHGEPNAARLWWTLKRLSHPSVVVLDGGINAWEVAGFPIASGQSTGISVTTTYQAMADDSLIATTDDVLAALDDPTVVIIDARTQDQHALGHIPGAIGIPADENFAEDGSLLPVDDLLALYTESGVTPDSRVIVYCEHGIRSTNTVLALTHLGYENVRLYPGSFAEWSSDPTRPVET